MEMNPTRNREVSGLIPGLAQWAKDLALLWLWRCPAAETLIGPQPRNLHMPWVGPLKKAKKIKKITDIESLSFNPSLWRSVSTELLVKPRSLPLS